MEIGKGEECCNREYLKSRVEMLLQRFTGRTVLDRAREGDYCTQIIWILLTSEAHDNSNHL